jgi:hypothetical protein
MRNRQRGLRVVDEGGKGKGYFLSFLGTTQELVADSEDGTTTTYKLPAILKGGVTWMELQSK